jgi:octaprenyl-diphosphate synthase
LTNPVGVAYYDPMKEGLGAPSTLTIQEVLEAYGGDLEQIEALIQKNLDSSVPLLNQIAQYILSSGGKRFRPLLVAIGARLCGYTGRDHILLATLVEFIHTATLLHDDVIDQGELRRGKKSVRTLWGNHPSILVGDYLYVSAATHSLSLDNQEVNYALLGACRRMIEGEIIQFTRHGDPDIKEEEYLNIIQNKTASLISTACILGAIISGAPESKKKVLAQFGMDLGTAFQVADDTLDYVAEKNLLGKALGNDLNEGKITLPLLHLISACAEPEREKIHHIIARKGADPKDLEYIIGQMRRYGSIKYALDVAHRYVDRAKSLLTVFEDSPHKKAMEVVADYVVTRDH